MGYGRDEINNAELADRGIEFNDEHYIEYEKRPPHDKYLWAIRRILELGYQFSNLVDYLKARLSLKALLYEIKKLVT